MLKLLGDTTDKRHWECTVCKKQIHIDLNDHDQLQSVPNNPCPNCEKQKLADPVGKTYGQLTVKEKLANGQYLCQCTCGAMTSVYIMNLRTGRTKSCGCLKAQQDREARIDTKRQKATNLQMEADRIETSALNRRSTAKDQLETWHAGKMNDLERVREAIEQRYDTKAKRIEQDYGRTMKWVHKLQFDIEQIEKEIEADL